VKEIRGRRLSFTITYPTSAPPQHRVWIELKPNFASTSFKIIWTAIAHRLVVGAGFQTIRSPQMNAIAAFHPATATGKLNAVMHPMSPNGFHYSIIK
jgi:hypothetical protein